MNKKRLRKFTKMVINKKEIKEILIFVIEHIGDLIITFPIIKSLKKNLPKSKITVIVGPWNKKLAEAFPYIDEVIIFDNPFIERHLKISKILGILTIKIRCFIKFFRKTRKKKYDLLIIFSDRKFHRLLLPFFRAKTKLYGGNVNLINDLEIKRHYQVLKPLNLKRKYLTAKLNYSKEDKKIIENIFKKYHLGTNKFFVIHPITYLKERNWCIERWAQLIDKIIIKNSKIKFLLVGTKEQKEDLDKIIQRSKNKKSLINLAGRINLVQLSLLVEKSDLFIGLNSGPKHLACLTNTPSVTIHGPSTEKRWWSYQKKDKFLVEENLNKISVEDVLKLIKYY